MPSPSSLFIQSQLGQAMLARLIDRIEANAKQLGWLSESQDEVENSWNMYSDRVVQEAVLYRKLLKIQNTLTEILMAMTAPVDRMKIYNEICRTPVPEILDPVDVPTAISDMEMIVNRLSDSRFMRDDKSCRSIMFTIAHMALHTMQKFGVAWRLAEGVAHPEGPECSFTPASDNREVMVGRALLSVDCERSYQDNLGEDRCAGRGGGNTIDKNPLSQGASYCMMRHYISQAGTDWTMSPGDEVALHVVRKIAAIAVRDMETHGMPFETEVNEKETK